MDSRAVVDSVHQRTSRLVDPPVANVDHALLVFSLERWGRRGGTFCAVSNGLQFVVFHNFLRFVDEAYISFDGVCFVCAGRRSLRNGLRSKPSS